MRYNDALPCPNCGCTELIQQVVETEELSVTEDGKIETIHPRDPINVISVECTDCEELIWEDEDE